MPPLLERVVILFNLIYWFIHDVLSNQGVFWRLSNDIVVLDSVVPMCPLTSSPLLGLFHDSRRAETAWGQPCVQLRSCTGPKWCFPSSDGWEDQAHTSRPARFEAKSAAQRLSQGCGATSYYTPRIFRLCQTYKIHVNPCKSNVFSGVSPWIFNFGVYCISGQTPFHCRKIAWNWAEEFFVKDADG